jgi:hypothetical protein
MSMQYVRCWCPVGVGESVGSGLSERIRKGRKQDEAGAGSQVYLRSWLDEFLRQPVSPPATGNTVPVI